MPRLNAVVLSPNRITQFGSGRMYSVGERLVRNNRQVIVLPQFFQAFSAGERAVEVIEEKLDRTKLASMDLTVVFLKKEFLGVVEHLARSLPSERLVWVSCDHTRSIEHTLSRAGHINPSIVHTKLRCAGDQDAGYLIENLLDRGQVSIEEPRGGVVRLGTGSPRQAIASGH